MKKMIRVVLIVIIAIGLLKVSFIGYVYYAFNNYNYTDTFEIKAENLSYYPTNYTNARANFRAEAEKLMAKFPLSELSAIKVPCAHDTDLTVDFFYLPALADTAKLIVISSGVHGVEGYVGSAMQQLFMQQYIDSALLTRSAVLFIHSVNPYGFKYSRRVSENNVDLNRNSSVHDSLYATINDGYPKVYNLINPHTPLDMTDFSKTFFFVSAVKKIIQSSMPVLRQAVLQGQYQYPEGLYFGGKTQEPQIRDIIPVFEKYTAPYSDIIAIDMHTGYGERGKLHLFPNPVDSVTRNRMENIFAGYQIDWGDSKDFYTITGDFVNYLGQIVPNKKFIPMSFEYGTKDSQTTLGSLKSIEIMIAENQGVHYGYKSQTDSLAILPVFIDMYFPDSEAWRSHCITITKQMYNDILPRFLNDK